MCHMGILQCLRAQETYARTRAYAYSARSVHLYRMLKDISIDLNVRIYYGYIFRK